MKKKLVAGAVTLLSVVTLAACANGTNKDIVTMKGDTITVSDFYNEIKTNQGAQQVLFQMTINKVFEKEYGSKVSDKEVDKELAKQKKQLGNQFDAYLAQQGLTEETAKKQIRSNMLLEYAVNQAAKKDIKDSDYKAAFESYTPEVTAQIIKLDAEDKAKEVLEAAKAEGADFAMTGFFAAKAYRNKHDSKFRELSIISILTLVVVVLISISNFQNSQSNNDQFQRSLHFIEVISKELDVKKEDVYVNTSAATDGAILKVGEVYYRAIAGSDPDRYLLEKMDLYKTDVELVEVNK